MSAHGLDLLKTVIGQKLIGVSRIVLGLGRSADEHDHGVTELQFERKIISVEPGPNEDFIVISEGPVGGTWLDPEYCTPVDLSSKDHWRPYIGSRLEYVSCYTDGYEDVALIFHFEGGRRFSIVLFDTDLLIAEELEPFENDPEESVLKLREEIK
jgi:hypothetical protein